ncbi:MAG TPA: ComF family protein [Candidatus Dormibacteraeota bacterium]
MAAPERRYLDPTYARGPRRRGDPFLVRLATLLDSIAPSRCAGCDRSGRALCEECVDAIEATPSPIVAGAAAAFEYGAEVRRIMHHGKFRDCRAALRAFAWLGAERLDPPSGAVVTPVPLARRRAVERGYNQARVVAQAFADFHRLPLIELLERTRNTPAQSTLDRSAREANVAGAFVASPRAAGMTLWLVDDVRTTGATTAAAKLALSSAGAARVEIAVLAAVA